jgi:TRAP-type C4-dicarboxylate transport system permease large subunit
MPVYVGAGSVDVDMGDAFRGAAMFLIADFSILALLLAFPEMVTWLPGLTSD